MLMCELFYFFMQNIASKLLLFMGFSIIYLLLVVLMCPDGSLWHSSISNSIKSIPHSLQMPFSFTSGCSSDTSLEILDISTLFLLLYCSILACCFSSSVTHATMTALTFRQNHYLANKLFIFCHEFVSFLPSFSFSFSVIFYSNL